MCLHGWVKGPDSRAAATFYISHLDFKSNMRLSDTASIYTAEILAIKYALEYLLAKGIHNCLILSHCPTSLRNLETTDKFKNSSVILNIHQLGRKLNSDHPSPIMISWVPQPCRHLWKRRCRSGGQGSTVTSTC